MIKRDTKKVFFNLKDFGVEGVFRDEAVVVIIEEKLDPLTNSINMYLQGASEDFIGVEINDIIYFNNIKYSIDGISIDGAFITLRVGENDESYL